MSLPVTRSSGRALLVSNPASRATTLEALQRLGFTCGESDDPYRAMAEFCQRPLAYRAIILSLASLYREELIIVRAIKRRFPHAEVWLTHTDGRQGMLAEAMRLGADGLIDDEGLHRIAVGFSSHAQSPASDQDEHDARPESTTAESDEHSDEDLDDSDRGSSEPLLSADELRALLQEQPSGPHAGGNED